MFRGNLNPRHGGDGTDESQKMPALGSQPRVGAFDPFANLATTGNGLDALTNLGCLALNLPQDTPPTTPVTVTFADVLAYHEQVRAMQLETATLRELVRDLTSKVEGQHATSVIKTQHANVSGVGPPSPFGPHVFAADSPTSSGYVVVNTPRSRPGVSTDGALQLTLPLRPSFASLQSTSSKPTTPTTPTTPSGPGSNVSSRRGTGGKNRNRHRRTQTPVQLPVSNNKLIGDEIMVTPGTDRQDDRGLLSDFFNSIRDWVNEWTNNSQALSEEDLAKLMGSCVTGLGLSFLGKAAADTLPWLLTDARLRVEAVVGVVSYDIVYNTLSDNFLLNSNFLGSDSIASLNDDFNKLGQDEHGKKHDLLLVQKNLYSALKATSNHRATRAAVTKKLADDLIAKLGKLLSDTSVITYSDAGSRDQALHDLFIKGYRIGFRMRMEPVKWRMMWPTVGADFNTDFMVNESRMLHGTPFKTHEKIMQAPGNYTVRFGLTPTIMKFDYSSGDERKELIHKAVVHVERKASYIGAERNYFATGSRY